MPFSCGRWDGAAQAHIEVGVRERSRPVPNSFRAQGAFNPAATGKALGRVLPGYAPSHPTQFPVNDLVVLC